MSGRNANFREGDRSEYLAQYLLSAIGTASIISRQEDTGFDFSCYLKEDSDDKHYLTFSDPFLISVKSESCQIVEFGSNDEESWKVAPIKWLESHKIPLLFGFVNKAQASIEIYGGSTIHLLAMIDSKNPARVVFKRRNTIKDGDMTTPTANFMWPENSENDGYEYMVDLGEPIVSIEHQIIENKDCTQELNHRIGLLRKYLRLVEQRNLDHRSHAIPFRFWTNKIQTNQTFAVAAFVAPVFGKTYKDVLASQKTLVWSLAQHLFELKNQNVAHQMADFKLQCLCVISMISKLDESEIPEFISTGLIEPFKKMVSCLD